MQKISVTLSLVIIAYIFCNCLIFTYKGTKYLRDYQLFSLYSYPELAYYIEIKRDFSDIEERLNYYISHPDEALSIIRHAHEWVNQFRDTRRETLISLLTLDKYFRIANGEGRFSRS